MTLSKIIRTELAFVIALVVLAQLLAITAHAVPLWTETFTNTSSPMSNTTYGAVLWNVYEDNSDLNMTGLAQSGSITAAIAGKLGNPNDGTYGFAAIFNGSGAQDSFNVFRTGISVVNPGLLSWQAQKNANTPLMTLQVMVQVAGQWYVSASALTPTSFNSDSSLFATSTGTGMSFNFALETSWYNYTLSSTGSMASNLGSLTTLDVSQQTITGIGFYEVTAAAQGVRIDSLVIDSVPEPTTAMLLGVGALGLFWQAKRRRS